MIFIKRKIAFKNIKSAMQNLGATDDLCNRVIARLS